VSKVEAASIEAWPELPLARWEDTRATLHMWMQVVGKIALALTPRTNHYWNIAFHFTPRGLSTLPMNAGGGATLSIVFDFVSHELVFLRSDGATRRNPLRAQTVADFYRETMATVQELGVHARVWPMPVEIPDPIRFEKDVTHRSYDPVMVGAFWRILLTIRPIFESFRCRFIGKCSPVHFFWGSMDLAVTRFSGRRAPERPDADAVTRESYSHEVISHGFWPGSGAVKEAAFYAYAAPEPPGFREAALEPPGVTYNTDFSIFILPYDIVRAAERPADALNAFLGSSYEAAARLAGWNRAELERR
jgi:hypothetical protein